MNHKIATVFIGVCLAAGCGSKKDEAEGGDTENSVSVPDKPVKQTIAEVFAGSKSPELVGHFAKTSFGMTDAELKKASPMYAEHGYFLSANNFGVGYFASLNGDPKKMTALLVDVKSAELATVEAAWGAPVKLTDRGEEVLAWHNASTKTRAMATANEDGYSITIEPYLPAAEILGPKGGPLGVESAKAFLGATPDELKAAYPANFTRSLDTLTFLSWPSDEYGDATKFQLGKGEDEATIQRIQFWLHHGDNPEVKAAVLALLVAKWGASSEYQPTIGKPRLKFADDATATAGETEGAWVIEIKAAKAPK